MSEKRRFEVRREFDYRPAPVLLHGSQSLLARSQVEPIGALWKRMGALLLAAFTVEGFINTVGPVLFKDRWTDSDGVRGLEWKSWDFKLKQIAKVSGASIDFGQRPWSSVQEVFKARDHLAHPKPRKEYLAPIVVTCYEDEVDALVEELAMTKFDRLLQAEALGQAIADIEAALKQLSHSVYGSEWEALLNGLKLTSIRDLDPL